MELYIVGIIGLIVLLPVIYALILLRAISRKKGSNPLISERMGIREKALTDQGYLEGKSLEQWEVINVATRVSGEEMTCPQCGSKLVLQHGKQGAFYGCSSFPECRYSVRK